jgi:hypothetical protein
VSPVRSGHDQAPPSVGIVLPSRSTPRSLAAMRGGGIARRLVPRGRADCLTAFICAIPRTRLRHLVEKYTGRQRKRLDVLSALTGWAPTHGRATLLRDDGIEFDVWWIENRSPRVDPRILLRTPLALSGGTYRGESGGWRGSDVG